MDEKEKEKSNQSPAPDAEQADNQPADKLPKTQAELDALIEKRIARDRKSRDKADNTKPALAPEPETQEPVPEATAQAEPDSAQEAPPEQTDPATEETAVQEPNVMHALLFANAQLEAIKGGVRAEVVEDAVSLAVMQAERNGEADAQGISSALQSVLERHPEWTASATQDAKPTGFKVGIDTSEQEQSDKKPLPSGRIIF